jgi:hypothetical protein
MEQISMEQNFQIWTYSNGTDFEFWTVFGFKQIFGFEQFQIWTISEVNSFKLEHFWI